MARIDREYEDYMQRELEEEQREQELAQMYADIDFEKALKIIHERGFVVSRGKSVKVA